MDKQFRDSLLADLVHTVFVYSVLRFDASTKKLFVSFHYHVFCMAAVVIQVGKYRKYSVLTIIFRYSDKI